MTGRRSPYEIYWEILVYCRKPRSFSAIISRCDLNSKTGQEYTGFLVSRDYLSRTTEDDKTLYTSTARAAEYIERFTEIYRNLFDAIPGFRL
jgi:predicted transcriptional regulator